MFDNPYRVAKINHSVKSVGEDKLIEYTYSFRGKSGKRYIVIVEQYSYYVFVVKFCLQDRKYHPDRFNQITKLNECGRILSTMGFLMKEMYNNNPYASFGFIGSNSKGESKENTKRFKIYSSVVQQLISPVIFYHRKSLKNSAYLLINKNNPEPELFLKVNEMFDRIYLLNA